MFNTLTRLLVWCFSAAIAVVGVASVYLYLSTYHPGDIESEAIVTTADAPLLQPGQSLKVLTWNLQFMAGNKNNYFYFDGGTDPWPSLDTVTKVTQQVADYIRLEDPDVLLLQELDEGATRTHMQNQLQALMALLPADYVAYTSSYYWKAGFIPVPDIPGSVGMKLAIISKYRIANATRYALSPITNHNILERQFNPKRAMLGVEMPVAGGGKLRALNVHLSAFSQGTDTMQKQVSKVAEILSGFAQNSEPALVGGDFNLVPSMVAYDRLTERNKEYYNPKETEITTLFKQFQAVPSLEEADGPEHAHWYTHSGNHNRIKVADKTIDYIFYTGGLTVGEHYVDERNTELISDHFPVVANFTVPSTSPMKQGER